MPRVTPFLLAALILLGSAGTARAADDRVGFGEDVVVGVDETVAGDVVVIGADARVDGVVSGDVVVIGGELVLAASAVVRGDAMRIGGEITRAEGSEIGGATVSLDPEIPGTEALATFSSHCLLYTSPSPRDATLSRMPSSA